MPSTTTLNAAWVGGWMAAFVTNVAIIVLLLVDVIPTDLLWWYAMASAMLATTGCVLRLVERLNRGGIRAPVGAPASGGRVGQPRPG
jgi:hypothetical protein